MKKVFTFLLCLICFGAIAQSKIGYVDLQAVFDSLPEKKVADDKVGCFVDSLSGVIRVLTDSYLNAPCGRFGLPRTHPNSPMAIIDSLASLQGKIPVLITTYSDNLYDSIKKSINTALDAVAKEHGYNYVLDSSTGSAYALKEGVDDLTPLIMRRLGLK
jgi:outer membrane protein